MKLTKSKIFKKNTIDNPKMLISGSVGKLTVLNNSFTINDILFGFGVQQGSAFLQTQENRTRTIDSEGNDEISLTAMADGLGIGGKSSQGYTITEATDIQSFFKYRSDFLFYGDKPAPGYIEYLGDYLSKPYLNPFALDKPIVGAINESATYTGPAN